MHIGNRYGKTMKIIYPGECCASAEDEFIATLLGSCISVVLYDPERRIAGMNHFMLPGRITSAELKSDDVRSGKYGVTAMKELLQKMTALGAKKENLTAKIFGGGNVIDMTRPQGPVSEGNIRLARIMVELEDIPILHEDIGGRFTRKIILEVPTGKVFLKKTTKDEGFDSE